MKILFRHFLVPIAFFGPDKPFGTIKYYRYPHTMEREIKAAVKTILRR